MSPLRLSTPKWWERFWTMKDLAKAGMTMVRATY